MKLMARRYDNQFRRSRPSFFDHRLIKLRRFRRKQNSFVFEALIVSSDTGSHNNATTIV